MAQCIVYEYSNFCPLDKNTYGSSICIDGVHTQGEFIADNGGNRAYKNYVDLYDSDSIFPIARFQFNPELLFFLSFAQVWFQLLQQDFLRQIFVDLHSGSIYRVLGSIRKSPAVNTAFNFSESSLAPDEQYNSTYRLPNVQTDLTLTLEASITSTNVEEMNAFQIFTQSVNTRIDPCNDFFAYACRNVIPPSSLAAARSRNLIYMSQKLEDQAYQETIKQCSALTKEKQLYNACVKATVNLQTKNQILISKNYVKAKMNTLQRFLGQPFTLLTGGTPDLPNAKQLANGLGYLSFSQGIDTLISPSVDTYWIDNTKGYQMFIDQNFAYLYKTYYQPAAWKMEKPSYFNTALEVIKRYAKEQKIALLDTLNDTLSKVLDYEQYIVAQYSTDDDTRRQAQRSWNLMKVRNLATAYNFLDWATYFSHVPSTIKNKVTAANFQVSVMETDRFTQFSADYAKQDPSLLVNLLYVRLLLGKAEYIPSYASAFHGVTEESIFLGLSRRQTIPKHVPPSFDIAANDVAANDVSAKSSCASIANDLMQFANGRVFVDYLYPTDQDVQNIRTSAGRIVNNVIRSFQKMINQLDWMTADTKRKAYDKTVNIQKNIAFPDWIKNDILLSAYYQDLVIDDTDNYYDILDKLVKFQIELQYNQLNAAQTDRSSFHGQPGSVNAWYQPALNSITFGAGLLVPPYFNPKGPTSRNYGGIGFFIGHELTHGFDDKGLQWGPTGNLAEWMDDSSKQGFVAMAQCVIDEYSKFCPLEGTKYPTNCVKGSQTQTENIADNGGIHAAFNAYKTQKALDGPDLLDLTFGKFAHDQLFFISFAQIWCEVRRSDDELYTWIMTNPHSPYKYRVFGTIQNIPAFRTAFNCPLGSNSAPKDHCDVWVPKNSQ